MEVAIMNGRDMKNLENYLEGKNSRELQLYKFL